MRVVSRLILLFCYAIPILAFACAEAADDPGFAVSVPGRLIYVASSGNDAAPGTSALPLKTISAAAQLAMPGDAVLVSPGVYRERVSPLRGGEPGRPIIYKARPGQRVVITGSDAWAPAWARLRHASPVWTAIPDPNMFTDDCYWTAANPFKVAMSATPGGRDGKPEAALGIAGADPKLTYTLGQIFVAGELLPQAGSLAEVEQRPGSWWCDAATGRIHVHLRLAANPWKQAIEITTRRRVFAPHKRGLGYIHVIGFVIERCGNQFPVGFWSSRDTVQAGALGTRAGHHWEIRGNLIRFANGIGMDIGGEGNLDGERTNQPRPSAINIGSHLIEGNWVTDNGVAGISGSHATRMVIRNNVVMRNNSLRFDGHKRLEQAGIKLHTAVDSLIEGNYIADNHTYGIYHDSGGSFAGARMTRNLITGNEQAGIHMEQANLPADSVLIDTNVMIGNGGAGIYLHGAGGVSIVHNVLAGSRQQGFMRGVGVYVHLSKAYGGLSDTSRVALHGNVIVDNDASHDFNYPTAWAAKRSLIANLYDSSSSRSFLINPYAADPTPSIPQLYTWVHRDLGAGSPGIAAFTAPMRAKLTFAEWKKLWGRHVANNDGTSIADPGIRLAWDRASTTASLTFTQAAASLAVPRQSRLTVDYSGRALPAGSLKPGPWQGLTAGSNVRQCWNGLPVTSPLLSLNTAPKISGLSHQTIPKGTSTGALAFTVGDAETAAGNLTVTATSSNTTLVQTSGIRFGGSGATRLITITPMAGQIGIATITVTVSDGRLTAKQSLVLYVNLMTGTVNLTINFQPAQAPVPAHVFTDTGKVYGKRGNGYSYGWWTANEDGTQDRNSMASPDQKHDTVISIRPGGTWEIGVPNGTYEIRLVAGDPSSVSGRQQFLAEGEVVMDGMPKATALWVDRLATVTVTDGRLTISHGLHGGQGKWCFLEVHSLSGNG